MNLHLLRQTNCLAIYYDSRNDWLYLDWQGDLNLPDVQQACLELAACYLQRPYARVLNNNEQVAGVSWGIAAWLVSDFLPYMSLAGIEHVAWIHSSSLWGHSMMHTVLNWLPGSLIASFSTMAEAVTWLEHTRAEEPQSYLVPQRSSVTQATLAQEVQALRQRVAAHQRKLHPARSLGVAAEARKRVES